MTRDVVYVPILIGLLTVVAFQAGHGGRPVVRPVVHITPPPVRVTLICQTGYQCGLPKNATNIHTDK